MTEFVCALCQGGFDTAPGMHVVDGAWLPGLDEMAQGGIHRVSAVNAVVCTASVLSVFGLQGLDVCGRPIYKPAETEDSNR